MKVEYVNPFIEAGIHVLGETTHLDVNRGMPAFDVGAFGGANVFVVVQIAGDVEGQVVYGVSMSAALRIAGRMMGGVELGDLDETAKSAIAELGNMIAGNAASRFAKQNIRIAISTPTVTTGSDIRIGHSLPEAVVVPLDTQMGRVTVCVHLQDSTKRSCELPCWK